MIEAVRGSQWLATTLASSSVTTAGSTGVYEDVAPTGAAFPFVLYGLQSGQDSNSASAYRLLTDNLFWVRAVGLASDMVRLTAIADAVDALLSRVQGTAGGAIIMQCVREQEILLTQITNGQRWRYVGGLYRLLINTGQ